MTPEELARRNRIVLISALGVVAVMIGLVAASPLFYGAFADYIGFGASLPKARTSRSLTEIPAEAGASITVHFDTNVDGDLKWTFVPEKRRVAGSLDLPQKVYLDVTNDGPHTMVVQTSFNVTPAWAAPYFFKVADFCKPLEKLGPGETARMPLAFYVDGRIRRDRFATHLPDLTISYTFFARPTLAKGNVKTVGDLRDQSVELDRRMTTEGRATFVNDAPNG